LCNRIAASKPFGGVTAITETFFGMIGATTVPIAMTPMVPAQVAQCAV
jgi:hypothetical protein